MVAEQLPVNYAMTTQVVPLQMEDSLEKGFKVIQMYGIPAIPVIDKEGKLAGMVYRNDLDVALLSNFGKGMQIKDLMEKPKSVLSPWDSVGAAIIEFKDKNVLVLPITEDGILKGILTPFDLLMKA